MNILLKYWHFDPVTIVFIVMLGIGYLYAVRHADNAKPGFFAVAILFLIIGTCSPLHWLGSYFLFSAHMITHMLLFFVVPPLLVLALPTQMGLRSERHLKKLSETIAHIPWLAWMMGIAIMWLWHIPLVFHATQMHGGAMSRILMHAQMISLVLVGVFFWWPVFGPVTSRRLAAPVAMLYLFTACIGCSLLGLLITFSPAGTYAYPAVNAVAGISSQMVNAWGITPVMDKQIAGLIMWVPGCLIYLSAALYLLRQWFTEKEEKLQEDNACILKTKHI